MRDQFYRQFIIIFVIMMLLVLKQFFSKNLSTVERSLMLCTKLPFDSGFTLVPIRSRGDRTGRGGDWLW